MPIFSVSSDAGLPRLSERILAAASEGNDASRAAELQTALTDEARRASDRREAEHEDALLADLRGLARTGGIALNDEEARAFNTAVRQLAKKLEQEWGEPNLSEMSEAEQKALKQRMREEMERVAVKTLGEKGRALVEQIAKRSEKP